MGQAVTDWRAASIRTDGRRPGTRVTTTASAAPRVASTRLAGTPAGPSISAPPSAAPIAEEPTVIVDSQVKASVVACTGAIAPTSVFCTVRVGAIAVPPRKSSTPSAHGLEIQASGARPMVTPSSSRQYWRGSDVLSTRAPNHRPPTTEPSAQSASSRPDTPGEPVESANAGMATSRAPNPSISAAPLSSSLGMPGVSTVENRLARAPTTGTYDRVADDVAMPRAPTM